jgi:hypothetical protein
VLGFEQGTNDPETSLVGQELQHPDGGLNLPHPGFTSNYLRRHADTLAAPRGCARQAEAQGPDVKLDVGTGWTAHGCCTDD